MLKSFDRRWIRIAVFYAVAVAFSVLSRVYLRTSDAPDPALGLWGIYRHLLGGVGPFIGAFIVWTAFRPHRRMSFGGTYPPMGVAMLIVPAVVLGVMGVPSSLGIEPHVLGVALGIWIALYALLEETGWRGYLQDELRDWPALLRYAVVGVFWYAWHLTFVLGDNPLSTEVSNLLFLILASLGIGFVADRTRSIFAAAAFHIVGDILLTTATFKTLIPAGDVRLKVVLICVVIWLIMLRLWGMRDRKARVATNP